MNDNTANPVTRPQPRVCIVVSAYDAGVRNSEGYVARSLLACFDHSVRVILITRRNNVAELRASPEFKAACPHVHLVGYDLPKWAAWWKKGPRGYGLYSYLWQISWPFVLLQRRRLTQRLSLVHTLNFHNDSIPSMGWILGKPSVWGPINHNEGVRQWRMRNWPVRLRMASTLKAAVRSLAWRLDPLLALSTRKADVVFSAGSWVDRRLRLTGRANMQRMSQLGLDVSTPCQRPRASGPGLRLVSGGRLDWIKGLDLALDALAQLPPEATLTLIGDGPCKGFLVDHAKSLRILDRVTFMAFVPRDQLLQLYSDHDIFLFPSAEAAGLAWVEALAMGMPVVGFEGPSEVSEMAKRLPGIQLARDMGTYPANAKALAKAIKDLATRDEAPEMIAQAARRHYAWNRLATEIQNAYRAAAEVLD